MMTLVGMVFFWRKCSDDDYSHHPTMFFFYLLEIKHILICQMLDDELTMYVCYYFLLLVNMGVEPMIYLFFFVLLFLLKQCTIFACQLTSGHIFTIIFCSF